MNTEQLTRRIRRTEHERQLTAHIEIARCPFCGAPAALAHTLGWWQVECAEIAECGASGPARPGPTLAADAWNRRAPHVDA